MIFTRAQWKSWLVKGAFIIAGYSAVLALHFLASILGFRVVRDPLYPNKIMASWATSMQWWLIAPGLALASLTAIYTAYLFAQAKARDLWQNPLLPPHLLVQSLLLSSAAWLLLNIFYPYAEVRPRRLPNQAPFSLAGPDDLMSPLLWILAVASLVHLLMIWG